jgi:hypothetical protein
MDRAGVPALHTGRPHVPEPARHQNRMPAASLTVRGQKRAGEGVVSERAEADMAQGTQDGIGRRHLMRMVPALAAPAVVAAALAPLLRDVRTPAAEAEAAGADYAGRVAEETYRGRHIRVIPAATASGRGHHGGPACTFDVRVDGRALPVMRRADGSWLSTVDHYRSFPTPLEAARAAVDELHGARLATDGPMVRPA